MLQSQEVVVERLITAIQRVQLSRMTGTLIAKRGDGVTYEEGIVTFTKGQISQTKVGRRSGPDALNWLSTWSNCSCSFSSSSDAEVALFSSLLRTSSSIEANAIPETTLPSTATTFTPTSPLRRLQVTPPPVAATPRPNSFTSSMPPTPSPINAAKTIPQRIRQAEEALYMIDSQNLSRTHRHLFLLIDGNRSLSELVRLLKRSESDILNLLRDLEIAAVIRLVYSQ